MGTVSDPGVIRSSGTTFSLAVVWPPFVAIAHLHNC
jgi:hypothetical protein